MLASDYANLCPTTNGWMLHNLSRRGASLRPRAERDRSTESARVCGSAAFAGCRASVGCPVAGSLATSVPSIGPAARSVGAGTRNGCGPQLGAVAARTSPTGAEPRAHWLAAIATRPDVAPMAQAVSHGDGFLRRGSLAS